MSLLSMFYDTTQLKKVKIAIVIFFQSYCTLFSIRNSKKVEFEVFFRSKIRLSDDSAQFKACYKSRKCQLISIDHWFPRFMIHVGQQLTFKLWDNLSFRLSRRIQFFLGNYLSQFCFYEIKIPGGLKKERFPNKIESDQIDVSEQAGWVFM